MFYFYVFNKGKYILKINYRNSSKLMGGKKNVMENYFNFIFFISY